MAKIVFSVQIENGHSGLPMILEMNFFIYDI
jgi:hypothetical protein